MFIGGFGPDHRNAWTFLRAAFTLGLLVAILNTELALAGATDSDRDVLARVLDSFRTARASPNAEALYLRAPSDRYRVLQLRLLTDGGGTQTLHFTPAQADAVAAGGTMWLTDLETAPAPMQVELMAYPAGAPMGETPDAWQWALSAGSDAPEASIVLSLQQRRWWPRGERLTARFDSDSRSLRSVAAIFSARTGRPVAAAAKLLQLESGGPLSPAAEYYLALALSELGLDTAGRLRAIASEAGPFSAHARLQLGLLALGSENLPAARDWVQKVPAASLPPQLHSRHDALVVGLQIGPGPETLSDVRLSRGEVALSAFQRATAQPAEDGRRLLNRLGRLNMMDELGWSARDEANLMLGFGYLRDQDPRAAELAFSRIRTIGHVANAGRLGLGWAQITPGRDNPGAPPRLPAELGLLLRPSSESALANARRSTPFRTRDGVASGARAEDLQRALEAWSDLIGADPLDPAVQESMLAIPYALMHLGAYDQALSHLEAGLGLLQHLATRLQRAHDDEDLAAALLPVATPAWADWAPGVVDTAGSRWWRQEPWPEAFYVERLLRTGQLAPQQRQCQWLDEAARLLAHTAPGDRESQALRTRVEQSISGCRLKLAHAARHILDRWSQTVARYLAEAQLTLARLHEAPATTIAGIGSQ